MSALDEKITIELTVYELIKLQTMLEFSIKNVHDMTNEDTLYSREVWESVIESERVIAKKIENALNQSIKL